MRFAFFFFFCSESATHKKQLNFVISNKKQLTVFLQNCFVLCCPTFYNINGNKKHGDTPTRWWFNFSLLVGIWAIKKGVWNRADFKINQTPVVSHRFRKIQQGNNIPGSFSFLPFITCLGWLVKQWQKIKFSLILTKMRENCDSYGSNSSVNQSVKSFVFGKRTTGMIFHDVKSTTYVLNQLNTSKRSSIQMSDSSSRTKKASAFKCP